jgi:FkbM family methyltransferase
LKFELGDDSRICQIPVGAWLLFTNARFGFSSIHKVYPVKISMVKKMAKSLSEFVRYSFKGFRPRYRVATLIGKTLANRVFHSTWTHKPQALSIKIGNTTNTIWTHSLSASAEIYRGISSNQHLPSVKLRSSPTIIDCGANIGLVSLAYINAYPKANIHAIEPASDNFELLRKNLGGNDGIRIIRAAVSNQSGTGQLVLSKRSPSSHSMSEAAIRHQGKRERIDLITLKDYLDRNNIEKVDLLKLDIEGAEMDAIEGLGKRIRDVRVIVGEVHPKIVDENEVKKKLVESGFEIIRWERGFRGGINFETINREFHPA